MKTSLLWKVLASTSVAITLLLALAGWFVQSQTRSVLEQNLQSELEGSFGAYQSLWQSRADTLRSVSLVLSTMSDVRAAFQTNDRATIRDTAAEIWSRISQSSALFLVTDPHGGVIASLGGGAEVLGDNITAVQAAAPRFPAQTAGFALQRGRLYELVVTPVYVQMASGSGLLNVLVAGFPVDQTVALELRRQTGGSDFLFVAEGSVVASTLPAAQSAAIAAQYPKSPSGFAVRGSPLLGPQGEHTGDLLIVRSFDPIRHNLNSLLRNLIFIWAAAVLAGLVISGVLAHRILQPIGELDRAAALIARQEYGTRVRVSGKDELGRLASTFNAMCASIQDARAELIRQERISTIGRLSSSIVHDLRNPLAAIYGGAEMMMDGDLSEAQMYRIAGNIYRSSRAINDLLRELVDVSRGRNQAPELCRLSEVIGAAVDAQSNAADQQHVHIDVAIDPSIELPLERARVERVFVNLISNALEAMPEGGAVRIDAGREAGNVVIVVEDTGPGIPPSVRKHLFEPFVSEGKNGMGLGLALSRQTVLDHGGDIWADGEAPSQGARFCLRLPCQPLS